MIEFELALWLIPAFIAGARLCTMVWLGVEIGSRRIQPARLCKTRALVLASAGSKLAFI